MAQNTAFAKEVRKALIDKDMSVVELAKIVAEKTGKFCDSAYLYHIFRGDRNPPVIVGAIKDILELGEAVGEADGNG